MTARMKNPSVRAQRRHDLEPKADFVRANMRGKNAETRGVDVARARGKETCSAASASEIDVNKPLTEKMKRFVLAWAEGDTIPNACARAGYADDGLGYRLARMPNVLALKAQHEARYEESVQMTRKKVMDGMLESIEMAKLMSEPASMIAGWREIGKICGYYAPVEHKVKVDVSGNVVHQRLSGMSDADLLEMIAKGNPPTPLLESTHD